jgi:hypothetical protein
MLLQNPDALIVYATVKRRWKQRTGVAGQVRDAVKGDIGALR